MGTLRLIDTTPNMGDSVTVHQYVTFTIATRLLVKDLVATASSEMLAEVLTEWLSSEHADDNRSIKVPNGPNGDMFIVEYES
jgi:hypothetical protein